MQKWLAVLLAVSLLFGGCSTNEDSMGEILKLRQKLLDGTSCSFLATVSADYGDVVHEFQMQCVCDADGKLTFEVMEPESIAGITGEISESGGQLTFDEKVLAFEMLCDGQITPVSAPWLLIRSLRSGYIRGCGEAERGVKLVLDDSYQEDSLQLDILLDSQYIPVEAEILWQGRRILSLEIDEFQDM